jgi:hypothetical protein
VAGNLIRAASNGLYGKSVEDFITRLILGMDEREREGDEIYIFFFSYFVFK